MNIFGLTEPTTLKEAQQQLAFVKTLVEMQPNYKVKYKKRYARKYEWTEAMSEADALRFISKNFDICYYLGLWKKVNKDYFCQEIYK